jgi:galactokinase/mevalonate kinase-like predicted kinase
MVSNPPIDEAACQLGVLAEKVSDVGGGGFM